MSNKIVDWFYIVNNIKLFFIKITFIKDLKKLEIIVLKKITKKIIFFSII
jgi:hypothetical protein